MLVILLVYLNSSQSKQFSILLGAEISMAPIKDLFTLFGNKVVL